MGAFLLYTPGSTQDTATATLSNSLAFDVVTNENPQFPATVATHVVEEGSDVADNIRVGAKTVTLEVFISNEPIAAGPQFGTGSVQATQLQTPDAQWPNNKNPSLQVAVWFSLPVGVPLVGPLLAATGLSNQTQTVQAVAGTDPTKGQQISPQGLQFATPFDAVQQTHDALDNLRKAKQLLEVVGTKGTYDNMVITHFDMVRTDEEGSGARFTIELQEIRIVSTEVVNAPVPTKPRGKKNQSKGSQSTSSAPAGSASQSLLSLFQGFFQGQSIPGLQP